MRLCAGVPEDLQARLDVAPTAWAVTARTLSGAAVHFTSDDTPPGCLLASAAATGSAAAAEVRQTVSAIRARPAGRIERDMAARVLPEGTRAEAIAAMVVGLIQGMPVLARDGMGPEELLAVANGGIEG